MDWQRQLAEVTTGAIVHFDTGGPLPGPLDFKGREALLLIEASDQLDWQGDAHANLAEVHAAAGRADEAARAWARAVELYERKGDLVAAARARASADLDTSGSDLGTGGAGPGPGQADLAISGASLGAGEAELGAGGTGRLSRLV
ncbi:MAG: hypothetical protein M0017_08010 [Desulfobacteraceae bacterium]|nr:hypothetical protein [Desulfobacteraceae bacterium]